MVSLSYIFIGFIAGAFVGAGIGVSILALCKTFSESDDAVTSKFIEQNKKSVVSELQIQKIRDEAIREFAEGLKEKGSSYFTRPNRAADLVTAVRIYEIDTFVKEMTEDKL